MQFLLSKEEYDELKNRDSVELKGTTQTLQYACSAYANYYNTINKMTIRPDTIACRNGDPFIYCNDCPAVVYCPSTGKEYAK